MVTSNTKRFLKKLSHHPLGIVSIIIIILFICTAVFAHLLVPYDPYIGSIGNRLQAPSSEHLFGTDQIGRDLFSRVVMGSRIAILVGVLSVAVGLILGTFLGLVAGYYGGILESIIMRVMDVILSFPYILLVIAIISVLGPSIFNVMIAIGLRMLPDFARLVRSQVLSIREKEYILATYSLGASDFRILFLHILPNCFANLVILASLWFGTAVLAEATLSFLGLGIQPPIAAWGSMVASGRDYLLTHPHVSILSGIPIVFLVYAFNTLGDTLRDIFDPKEL